MEKKDIKKILEAARWAPSAENQQVWKFLVVDKTELKAKVLRAVEELDPRLTTTLQEFKSPRLTASFVFTSENFNALKDRYRDFILIPHEDDINCAKSTSIFIICVHSKKLAGKTFGLTDMGAAIANIIINSHNLGFGVRWIRNFNRERVREEFKISQSKIIDAILAIGKPVEEEKETQIQNKNHEEFYFYNQWGNILKKSDFEADLSSFNNYDVEAVDTIVDRRSIRRFMRKKVIPKGIVSELIKAGMMIPLTINKSYLKIIVIDNDNILNEIAENAKFMLQKQLHVKKVPLIFAITFDCTNNSPAFYAEVCTGAILQTIILRAHSLGIGSCWIGAFSRKNVIKILKIEHDWHLPSLVIFGYPKKYPKPTPRKSLGTIGYYNAWKNRIEKRHMAIIPNFHIPSIMFRKIKKTHKKTILRTRKVGFPKGIAEFEDLKEKKMN